MVLVYIYMVFSKTGTWLSKILKIVVRSKYVHSSIAFSEDLQTMYSFGRLRVNNPFSGGFVEENFERGVFGKMKNCECVVYRMEVTPEQFTALQKIINQFKQEAKQFNYNFIGLLAAAVQHRIVREKHYFCSQFVAEVLRRAAITGKGKYPELTRPADLMQDYGAVKIYEGFTADYARREQAVC